MKLLIEIELPDDLNFELSEYDLKMHLGVKLYEDGLLSTGFVASMLGMERRDFLENMGKYGGEIFKATPEEIAQEMEVVKQFIR